jgi:hypothetical protein
MANPWLNDDGLEIRFGLEQAKLAEGGKINSMSDTQELVIDINGVDVPTTDAPIEKHVGIPQGAFIESAILYVTTTFVGATATLDVGIMEDVGDGTYLTEDDNGLIAAATVASLTAGAVITGAGALIGAQTATETGTAPHVVSYGWNTAAFTAGAGQLVIKYRVVA